MKERFDALGPPERQLVLDFVEHFRPPGSPLSVEDYAILSLGAGFKTSFFIRTYHAAVAAVANARRIPVEQLSVTLARALNKVNPHAQSD